jgi:creatinine amidohydrolase
MRLENLSFTEVEAYLQNKDAILVPSGSVEQHSSYGLIGTDFIVSEAVARRTGNALQILVAPTICYGASSHHMAFAGTVTLSPSTLIAVVVDVVRSFVSHGFRRMLFINGHGGNIAPIQTAFRQLKAEGVPGHFDLLSWYADDDVRQTCKEIFGENEGQHATPSEVSITRYLRPSEFAGKTGDDRTVERPKYYWPLTAQEMKRVFPDGRMESAPWLATTEHGGHILERAVQSMIKRVEACLALQIQGPNSA